MADSPEAIRKSIRAYLLVTLTLFVFTALTVSVATVPWMDVGAHGFDKLDAIIGIGIASIKALCVMLIFMHLNHEKKLVYFLYLLSFFLVAWMFALLFLSYGDPIEYGTVEEMNGFYNPYK